MKPNRCKVALRIFHPNERSDHICRLLKFSSSRQWNVGEPRTSKNGMPLNGFNKQSYCLFYFDPSDSDDLEAEIGRVTGLLMAKKAVIDKISETGGVFELYVTVLHDQNAGAVLPLSLLENLVDLRLNLALDIYPFHDSKDPVTDECGSAGHQG